MEAPLGVPEVEREPDEFRLVAGDPVGEERVAERVRDRGIHDVEIEVLEQTLFPRGDGQGAGGERNVAGRGVGGWRRDRKLDESEDRAAHA